MNLRMLNRTALGVCAACLVAAVALILIMIWSEILTGAIAWKIWATVGVFFAVSLMTMTVTKKFQLREIEARKAGEY